MSTTQKELPQYQSHKKVWALKIKSIIRDGDGENRESDGSATITPEEDGYAPFKVSAEYMHKHKPQVGGYYVLYADGYASWSPADAFESGNKLITGGFPYKEHTNYPSRYKIGEGVFLNFPFGTILKWCKIEAVRFTESKIRYDILVPVEEVVDIDNPIRYTLIENVDSVFVIDEFKESEEKENIVDQIRNRAYEIMKNESEFQSIDPDTQMELICDELFQKQLTVYMKKLAGTGGVITNSEKGTTVESTIENLITKFTIPFLATITLKIDPNVSEFTLTKK